jgi:hypothetical protein
MAFMNLSREQQNELLFVGFNQDNGACASSRHGGRLFRQRERTHVHEADGVFPW